jgi:gluconokinase
MSLGEYLQWKLLGVQGASYSIASWSGLLNRHRLEWDAELLELLPVGEEQLSPLVDIDQSWSGLLEPFASRWPALRRCPWFPAVGDGAAANIGSGCVLPAKLALTMGRVERLARVEISTPGCAKRCRSKPARPLMRSGLRCSPTGMD